MNVLLVDDERVVASVMTEMLKRQGCEPIVAHTAAEARAILAGPADFRLAIVDRLLPDCDGVALLREVAAARPGALRCLISGSPANALPTHVQAFLMKPFFLKDIEQIIQTARQAAP